MIKFIFLTAGLAVILVLSLISCTPSNDLEWQQEGGYKWAELAVPSFGKAGFKLLSEFETGISFSNDLTRDQIKRNQVLLNGSGVAVGDIDGDGFVDLYFCRLDGSNVLYKNLGNWKFKDVTAEAGVACVDQFSTGSTFVDIDGDQDLDLLVTAVGEPITCFLNDGSGQFTDATQAAGFTSKTGATTMAFADIDGDGDLDLYSANYKTIRAEDIYSPAELSYDNIVMKDGDSYKVSPKYEEHYTIEFRDKYILWLEKGEPDILYLNDGKGHFKQVSFADRTLLNESGEPALGLYDWGLTVRFQDMDGDGDPDIYVCNDFESPDRIWVNDGTGRFQSIAKQAIRSISNSSMAVDFSDIDRDGDLDFFVIDMLSRVHQRRKTQMGTMVRTPLAIGAIENRPQYMRNTFYLNRGDYTYAEIAQFSGVQASEWSWSAVFLDVDLDGYEDMLISTGHVYDALDSDTNDKIKKRVAMGMPDYQNRIFMYPKLELPNIAFRNRGDLTFEEVGQEWGIASTDISHGTALGDFDNDGDMDFITNRYKAPAGVYQNESAAPRIAVRLRGLPPNTQGIGAKIRVFGGPVPQSKEVISGGTYLSSSDPLYVFATGERENNLTIDITWRSGKRSVIKEVKPNRIYEIYEEGAQAKDPIFSSAPAVDKAYFEDVSHLIRHEHHEDPYDDFKRQSLLPNRLSQLGPGVAWYDLNADGWDDLIIASGKGGSLAYLRNDGKGGFEKTQDLKLTEKTQYDQTTVLGWTKQDNSTSLFVGHSNFEAAEPMESFASEFEFVGNSVKEHKRLVGDFSSSGPMAMADYDNDGDLDIFVGGRTIPGQYPKPASSKLYRNENGAFVSDEINTERLKDIGMVSGAVFSDLDNDGDPDLILALEWGPVTVLRNVDGLFYDATEELGLSRYQGWWNGVTTGDLNEDGQLDIIATNWGLNNKYHYDVDHPLRIYYNDFDNNGTLDIVEAHFDPFMKKLVPERGLSCISNAVPYVRLRTSTYKKFGGSSIQEIVGPGINQASEVSANTLAHTVFFNQGERFEAVSLPVEAQFSPAFYVGVADFDGDGHEDVFISQNFFASQIETSRNDAGRGLWLKGDGSGKLQPIPGQKSGVKVYGEQRGAALGDYDRDGRVDLVVSQNGAATKLYHNVRAKPGLRVQLAGLPGNPLGIGAILRLRVANRYGPAREIHAGSGYWSQDSAVEIMAMPDKPTSIQVRWPGGQITDTVIPTRAREITINSDGSLKKVTTDP
ncbi:VCBS repeat-containing protein [Caldithrix abyssi]|nr:VCBS repeat-containing protein [Caldithrix abyssi]